MLDIGLFKNFCSILDVPTSQSAAGMLWQSIFGLRADFWPLILLVLILVIGSELLTRHRNPYNSANGFTPDFNRLVGSGSYMLLQVLLYVIVKFLLGDIAYCFPWPYIAHAAVFSLNFAILHGIGFWPEDKRSRRKRRGR